MSHGGVSPGLSARKCRSRRVHQCTLRQGHATMRAAIVKGMSPTIRSSEQDDALGEDRSRKESRGDLFGPSGHIPAILQKHGSLT